MDNMKLSDALATPRTVTLGGKELAVKPLNFNDLAALEQKFDDLLLIDTGKIAVQRYLVFFILSRTDDTLTEEQVGESLTLAKAGEASLFVRDVFTLSGFRSYEEPEAEHPNAVEPAEASPTGSETSPAGSPLPAASRRRKSG